VWTETDLPDTTYARDLAVSVERGDVSGMSFAFRKAAGGDSWDWSAKPAQRTLTDFDVLDVSTVTYPAYPTTTSEVRSLLAEHGVRALGPAVVAWDDEAGMCDYMDDVSDSLPGGYDSETGSYSWGYCTDATTAGDAALVVFYDGGTCGLFVVPVVLDEQGEPVAGDPDSWVAVEWQLVVSDDMRSKLRSSFEQRAGKAISSANAEHVQALADAHASMSEHLDALASASSTSDSSGDDEGDDTEKNGSNDPLLAERRQLEIYEHEYTDNRDR
jgi:hypothetical protein